MRLPPQKSWDGAWNDSNALFNVFKPISSGVDDGLSKFFSTRTMFAMKVNDLCDLL